MKQSKIMFIEFFKSGEETFYIIQYFSHRRSLVRGSALPKTAKEFLREREDHASYWDCHKRVQEDGSPVYTFRVWCAR